MGYWGAVTSSIDFCEGNYEVTSYIAEFWNSISSFMFCLIGIIDVLIVYRVSGRMMEFVIGICFIAVGLGSALFHATLRYEF
jgi:hypothetical protein